LLEYLSGGEVSPVVRKKSKSPCYFFCDEKIETQRHGTAILRSLIHQLLTRHRVLVKYLKVAYDLQGPKLEQNSHELWRIFVAITSDKRVGPISVIVDAIDECEENTRKRLLRSILELVDKSNSPTADSMLPCVKFLVTSRPQVSRQYNTSLLVIDPSQSSVEDDLKLVIEARIAGIVDRTHCSPEARIYLEKVLNSKADRTFLSVTLVLHLLETSYLASQKDFERIVDELPQDLTATYERFLLGISKEYEIFASRLLHLIVGSSRPLTLEEIRILIALQDSHQTLAAVEAASQFNIRGTVEGVLGPLIRIWDSRIYLVHLSLKEFLHKLSTQTENLLCAAYGIDPNKAALVMAEACISYLVLHDFSNDLFSEPESSKEVSPVSPEGDEREDGSISQLWDPFNIGEEGGAILFKDLAVFEDEACASIDKEYPFFDYAATHWFEHFATSNLLSSSALKTSARGLSDATKFPGLNWFRYYWIHSGIGLSMPQDFEVVVTACFFGHLETLEDLLQEHAEGDVDTKAEVKARGLYWAARNSHTQIVHRLLVEDVSPDAIVADSQTALIAAAQFDRPYIVQKLLLKDDGLIPDQSGFRANYAWHRGRTPLSIAAAGGFAEVTRLLLDHEHTQPDLPDDDQWTPLFWAISGNHLYLLMVLLSDSRVSANHLDKTGRNAISWAASGGQLRIVKHLLSVKHLNVDQPDHGGRTPLSWAAGEGHLEVTKFLRQSRQVDVSSRDSNGRNALSWACGGNIMKWCST
jgi:ankyrin repeat protein